jgi:hypothetical protein
VELDESKDLNYTVLVDRDIADQFWIKHFLRARTKDPLCRLVLLVTYPQINDWDPKQRNDIEFDAIVRNTGGKQDIVFKRHALQILRDASSYNVVSAVDGNYAAREMYRTERVPFVFDQKGHLEIMEDYL